MTYNEALAFIHGIQRFGSKLGLERISALLERMGNPQNKLRFIHVAGTNGKGSTCTMLSHILVQAGYKTGLYISPFVLDFRERIQLNNQMIVQEDLAACTELAKAHWDEMAAAGEPPTEFEVLVAVAMEYFVRQECDIVVLEVGMGGRFDATNIIGTPLCSVITSISIDHTEYLGDTLQKIAFEKCGIIKPGGVTVCYPRQNPEALAVIMEQCALKQNRLLMPGNTEVLACDVFGSVIRVDELEIHIPLGGEHQIYNTLTVLEAVKAIALSGFAITPEQTAKGIAATRFPSRLEVLCRDPLILLDGAHNLSGAQVLGTALRTIQGRRIHAVTGILADKDVDGILREIAPLCQSVTCVQPDNSRALPAAELAERARVYCHKAYTAETPEKAFKNALRLCSGNDILLIFGSLYLAGELRPIIVQAVETGIKHVK